MTDVPTPAPSPPSSGGGPVGGMVRNPWGVVGLSLITCGIYFWYWNYVVFEDMKERNGTGLGGVVALILAIIFPIVNVFMLPSEVDAMYTAKGKTSPVHTTTGFWVFIPLVGFIIWILKVQPALNEA